MNRKQFTKKFGIKKVVGLEIMAWKAFIGRVRDGESIRSAWVNTGRCYTRWINDMIERG